MNAQAMPAETAADATPASPIGPDALYAAFLARAAALPQGAVGAVDALLAEIVPSEVPDYALKPLAAAIAKATGADGTMLLKRMLKARGAQEAAAGSAQGTAVGLGIADPEQSADPKPLRNLLEAAAGMIAQRVFCAPEVRVACALWAAGTWGVRPPADAEGGPDLFPRLHIHAPAKRCGKSLLLETIGAVVRRPIPATDVSEAAIFRTIDRVRPTFLIDEADTLFAKNRDLTGIVNSGYARTGYVLRTVEVQTQTGRSFDPVAFPTYTPVALAGIGALPATIEDRSIRIEMQRQPAGQKPQRIGLRQLAGLRDKVAPHLMAHADAIGAAMAQGVPDHLIPHALNDRDADNWRPLLALAQLAGGDWLARAQRAAETLCMASGDGDRGNEWALRQVVEFAQEKRAASVAEWRAWVLGGRKAAPPASGTAPALRSRGGARRPASCRFVASDDLAGWLIAKDDSGFADARDTGPVKLRVARLMRGFGIVPTVRKVNGQAIRGYEVAAIRAVWRRYRP
jgi:hypothetical protein